LLRARRERRPGHRAAEKRDEISQPRGISKDEPEMAESYHIVPTAAVT
jgi:hypothetical protein